jgi:phosphoglycolate phosphatase-like HAD superfamily hydrolase
MSTLPAVIFDCDGVILQSNLLKSDAFGEVLEGHDTREVADFVAWHKATGGVSRFEKFARFFRDTRRAVDWEALTQQACADFGVRVFEGLKRCDTVPGLEDFVAALRASDVPLAVNTGGAEDEVRAVFAARGMAQDFAHIFGSPNTKEHNMQKLRDLGLAVPGAAYLGDSKLDFELAQMFDLRFFYISYESEWHEGADVTRAAGGTVVPDLHALAEVGLT